MIAFDANRLAYLELETTNGQVTGQPLLRSCGQIKIIDELSFKKDGNVLLEIIIDINDEGRFRFAPLGKKKLGIDKTLITMMQIRG